MIEYKNNVNGIDETMLCGFFVGWPNPPSLMKHLEILKGSYCFWLAVDTDKNKVVGFITAVSDGVLAAYIPLLEVLPTYQNLGIGKQLLSLMLDSLKNFYMIDLLCDADKQSYYAKWGMKTASGAFLRNFNKQSCE